MLGLHLIALTSQKVQLDLNKVLWNNIIKRKLQILYLFLLALKIINIILDKI